jgi:hypothetical protein
MMSLGDLLGEVLRLIGPAKLLCRVRLVLEWPIDVAARGTDHLETVGVVAARAKTGWQLLPVELQWPDVGIVHGTWSLAGTGTRYSLASIPR